MEMSYPLHPAVLPIWVDTETQRWSQWNARTRMLCSWYSFWNPLFAITRRIKKKKICKRQMQNCISISFWQCMCIICSMSVWWRWVDGHEYITSNEWPYLTGFVLIHCVYSSGNEGSLDAFHGVLSALLTKIPRSSMLSFLSLAWLGEMKSVPAVVQVDFNYA